jgi:hypothetical protein
MATPFAIAVLKFANRAGIPWLIFADADQPGRDTAEKLVRDHGASDMSRVVWGGSGSAPRTGATEAMLLEFDRDMCDAGCRRLGFMGAAPQLLGFMKGKKGTVGRPLAEELLTRHPWPHEAEGQTECWPQPVLELVRVLGLILTPRQQEA